MNDVIEVDVPTITQDPFSLKDDDEQLARQWWQRESEANNAQIQSVHSCLETLNSGNHDQRLDDILDELEAKHAILYEQSGLLQSGDLHTIRILAAEERQRIEQNERRNNNRSNSNSD